MEINKNNYKEFFEFVKFPLQSEKSENIFNKYFTYTVIVKRFLVKNQIKIILEKLFDCKITKINTMVLPKKIKIINKKKGFCTQYKKVYFTLFNNKKIENFFNK